MSRVITAVFFICFAAAVLVWLATTATALTLHQSDAAGNGMSYGFGIIGLIATWVLIAITVSIAFSQITTPGWVKLLAALGVIGSAAAAVTVFNLLKDSSDFPLQWPAISLIGPPLLMFAFAAWAGIPSVQRLAEPNAVFKGVWPVVIALSLLTLPLRVVQVQRLAREREAYMRDQSARESQEENEPNARLAAMTDSTPLREFLVLTTVSTEARIAALDRIKTLPNRQRDAIVMLDGDEGQVMGELRNLALDPTTELCERSSAFLRRHAINARTLQHKNNNRFEVSEAELEKYLLSAQWLAQNGCDMSAVVDSYKETALAYPESSERARFIKQLESLKTATGGSGSSPQ